MAGALLLGLLGTLVAVLTTLNHTNAELRRTNATLQATRAGVATTSRRVRAAPRIRGIAADVVRAARAGEHVAGDVRASDLALTLTELRSLANALTGEALPAAQRAGAALAAPGPSTLPGCAAHLRRASALAPGQLSCALRMLPAVRSLLRSQRHLNARTLRGVLATVAAFRESLAIQRELLVHVRSLDTKIP
jgi:hypothetical protein